MNDNVTISSQKNAPAQVEVAIDNLGAHLAALDKTICALLDRLQPVMRLETPTERREVMERPADAKASPLALRLDELSETALTLQTRIATLIKHLDV